MSIDEEIEMPESTRNIEEEMELVAHPVYGPLFLKFKEAFQERLKRPGEYLPEVFKGSKVLDMLEGLGQATGLGEAVLDMLAYSALQTVIEKDTEARTSKTTCDNLARWLELHEAKWGKEVSREKWLNNIVEECAELIQAIQHYKRKRVPFSAVRTEMADVAICSEVLVTIEDENGPPLTEDIARIAQYQVGIYEGTTPQIHNDGEDAPPNPVPVLVRSFPVDEVGGRCGECGARLRRVDDITILCPVCVEEVP